MQNILDRIRAASATLVAVSPMDLAHSAKTQQDLKLEYAVLSDPGNQLATQLGLTFAFSPAMRDAYMSFGVNLEEYNGDASWTLPMPAVFVLDAKGVVTWHFVDSDYTKRPEPETVAAELEKLAYAATIDRMPGRGLKRKQPALSGLS